MTPMETGRMPPPAPWRIRPSIRIGIDFARAATRQTTITRARMISRIRRLPNMSAIRPNTGVIADAAIR
jgi:hypothetical protein